MPLTPLSANLRKLDGAVSGLAKLMLCATLILCGYSQLAHAGPEQETEIGPGHHFSQADVEKARDHLSSGKLNVIDANSLATAHATDTLPALKRVFNNPAQNGDISIFDSTTLKEATASAIVRLGDWNSEAWDYLVKGVSGLLNSERPSMFNFGPDGKMLPEYSLDYSAYAKTHQMSEDELSKVAHHQTGMILYLGSTRDKRAAPLLRSLLSANQVELVSAAVKGLIALDDKDSIPLIVDTCRRSPKDLATALAIDLTLFHNTKADQAAKEFLPPPTPKAK